MPSLVNTLLLIVKLAMSCCTDSTTIRTLRMPPILPGEGGCIAIRIAAPVTGHELSHLKDSSAFQAVTLQMIHS